MTWSFRKKVGAREGFRPSLHGEKFFYSSGNIIIYIIKNRNIMLVENLGGERGGAFEAEKKGRSIDLRI